MKNLKEKYIGRALSVLMAGIVLPMFAITSAQAENPDEMARTIYLQAYSMTVRGNTVRDARDWEQSVVLYTGALDLYEKLSNDYPEWRSDVVTQLADDTRQQIAFVSEMLRTASAAAAAVDQGRDDDPSVSVAPPNQTALSELERENRKLSNRISQLQKEHESLGARHRRELGERLEAIESENQELKMRLSELSADGVLLTDSQLQQQVIALTEENLKLNEQITTHLAAIREMRSRDISVARLSQNYEKLMAENRELKAMQEQGYDNAIEEQRRLWRERFEEFQARTDAKEKEHRAERERLLSDLNAARNEIQQSTEGVRELIVKNEQLEQSLADLSGSERVVARLERDLERMNSRIENMTAKHAEEVERLNNDWAGRLDARNRRIERRLERLSSENEELKTKQEERQELWGQERIRLAAEHRDQFTALEKERDALRKELSELADHRDVIEQQRTEIERLVGGVQSLNEKHRSELERLRSEKAAELERLRSEKASELESVASESKARLETIQKQQSETRKQHEQAALQWRARFEELGANLKAMENQLKEKNEQMQHLERSYAETDIARVERTAAAERQQLQGQIEALRASLLRMRNERDALSEENFVNKAKLMELERRLRQAER